MPLSAQTATRKDRNAGYCDMEHRHFATIAAIIREMRGAETAENTVDHVAEHFARELAKTNPRFDRRRFLVACN